MPQHGAALPAPTRGSQLDSDRFAAERLETCVLSDALLACRYVALEEVAGAADDDARRFGGFHSSWRQQIADELRITRSRDKAQA